MTAHRPSIGPTTRRAMTPKRKREVLEDYGKACEDCGASLTSKVEYDHRIQLWLGGPDARANLRPLCIPCHKAKTADDATVRAKVKRIIRDADPETRKRSKRPIISAPFQTNLTRGFDGKTRPRRSKTSVTA